MMYCTEYKLYTIIGDFCSNELFFLRGTQKPENEQNAELVTIYGHLYDEK